MGEQCCECSDESWRKDAKGVLGSLQGLNRSQQRAIATAMSSTFTLWQVRSLFNRRLVQACKSRRLLRRSHETGSHWDA